jgi:hypothetical protein
MNKQTTDYYSVLGVSREATPKQVKSAYRRLALQYHPDKNASCEAEERFKEVSNAYQVLNDPQLRAQHDAGSMSFEELFNRKGNNFRTAEDIFREFFGEDPNYEKQETFVQIVPPSQVFNLPIFECFLVLDTRSAAQHAAGRVVSSVSFPQGDPLEDDAAKSERLCGLFTRIAEEGLQPECWDRIVLVGQSESDSHVLWLAEELRRYKTREKVGAVAKADHPKSEADPEGLPSWDPAASWWESFERHFIDVEGRGVYVVQGGYAAFAREYPGLSGVEARMEDMRPTPHHISDAPCVFVGSRPTPHDKRTMTDLGITHAIIATHGDIDMRLVEGVEYLQCDVVDNDSVDMRECWQQTTAFIQKAASKGGRVLVHLHGRSRSASVAMAWLVLSEGYEVREAARLIRKKVPRVDWGMVFPEQMLRNFEAAKSAGELGGGGSGERGAGPNVPHEASPMALWECAE